MAYWSDEFEPDEEAVARFNDNADPAKHVEKARRLLEQAVRTIEGQAAVARQIAQPKLVETEVQFYLVLTNGYPADELADLTEVGEHGLSQLDPD